MLTDEIDPSPDLVARCQECGCEEPAPIDATEGQSLDDECAYCGGQCIVEEP